MEDLALGLGVAVALMLLGLLVLGWRNRVMVRLGLRNIPRRRTQTALIVLGLMFSTFIIAAAFGTGDTMTHSFRSIALDVLGETDELINGGQDLGLFALDVDFGEMTGESDRRTGPAYFPLSRFESLQAEVAGRQADGNDRANLIEAMAPALFGEEALVVNYTARQSEPGVFVGGYDAATADVLDTLTTLDRQRVTIADLGPAEVYLTEDLAEQLAAEPGHELALYLTEEPIRVTVRGVVRLGALPGQLMMPLRSLQEALGKAGQINAILVSNVGNPYSGARHSGEVSDLLEDLLRGAQLQVREVKYTILFAADLIGGVFTTMFIGLGSFSIAAAMLLIFLIFVMLAAERSREMGIARAVGTRRWHLVQMFVFEGTAYDLMAAVIGVLLGASTGLATVGILSRRLEGIRGLGGFRLSHHLEPRSLIVAGCLGLLLTFATVAVSAWRVSRLNIVTAIRDLPPPSSPDAGLRFLFAQQGRQFVDAFRQLFRLRPHLTLKRFLVDGPASTLAFLWALIIRGPLTAVIGYLLLQASWGINNAFLYGLGVSLILIGIGLTLRWILRTRRVRPETRDRIAFSFAGISLLVFWMLPLQTVAFLKPPPARTTGPEIFVLSGIMMIAGAIWTLVYNSQLLLGLVTWLLRPFGSLLPVVRTALAYPLHEKVRTGLTIAMFSLVIFMLVFMSVMVNIVDQALQETEDLAGTSTYDIEAKASARNPIGDLREAIAASPDLNSDDYTAIRLMGSRFVETGAGRSYFITLAEGVDPQEAARSLESTFLDHGLETAVIEEQMQAQQAMVRGILGLMQSFMGMGLVVGSVSIGIISARAVVERRQQIGVLRSIGFRRRMVQWSFLLEASFVALLGILLGISLGLVLARNFWNTEVASGPGMGALFEFSIPWRTLGVIIAISYGTSMLTTLLPSWQASRIYPAEALRYE